MLMHMTDDEADAEGDYVFAFFEVVTVDPPPLPQLAGRPGTVLGRSRSEDGTEHYAVTYNKHPEVVMAEGQDMTSTGRIRHRDEFYNGATVHVTLDGRAV
jgi:hypothetical protein